METIGIILGALILLVLLYLLGLEIQYRRRPGNKLVMTVGDWRMAVKRQQHYQLVGEMELINRTHRLEIMVPEVKAEVTLLSGGSLEQVTCSTRIMSCHPDEPARADNYWFAYIVKVGKRTRVKVVVDIEGYDLSKLKTAWIRVHYLTYGPQGRIPKVRHVIVPFQYPRPTESINWRSTTGADVLPIKTHLLTPLDTPVEIVKRYVLPHAKPGDVVTIGETPIAIMQDRFHHASEVKPGWVATRLCYLFLPTSSLATACGMQSLIDVVGPVRVLFAFAIGAIAKVVGKRGVFYQLAGEQARLIDDVTGTLPPYDQFIVLGPADPQQVVDEIKRETGLSAAIVDVNDLRAVKVLAATSDVALPLLQQALLKNPAGNADEQTPVVLIRPMSHSL
ncbi:F420-0:Gamma-glutamyl ligase [Pantanalinema sp. GBBB05]|uniref:F420-0:Gamma-glutamyl ligase n=1 Tax=Pantanalinema sp. GBBB05 TaxID=2604139 RepID=UPI001E188500|nr:F420-0:Gamma-glutamyl ligase [Pantanalinema sp. GBBB05]